ncbi:hypothetical protein SDC49_24445 [Lactobacillus sp. R2/2]|nr:hypothetical protein [Lactobacillus sp. R2/2]
MEYMDKRKRAQKQRSNRYHAYTARKTVEKGTDWNKQKPKVKSDVSSAELKEFFKNFEDQNGMK